MEKISTKAIFDDEFETAIEDQLKQLMNDPFVMEEIKRLEASEDEVRENISAFLSFQEDHDYCSKCPGLAGCAKSERHYQVRLQRRGKFIERSYEPCPLLMAKIEQDSKYWYDDFPSEWKVTGFASIDGKKTRSVAIAAAIEVARGQSERWLFLNGSHRQGKTYLMVAFINEIVKSGARRAAVINAGVRFKELLDMAITDKPGFKQTFDDLCTIDVLGIDDFGNEYKSDFLRDQIVYPLLLERARNKKVTMFTSDFSIAEIGTLYSSSEAGRIRSRQLVRLLKDYCGEELKISGISGLY